MSKTQVSVSMHFRIPKEFKKNSRRIQKKFQYNFQRTPKGFLEYFKINLKQLPNNFPKILTRAYRSKSFSSLFFFGGGGVQETWHVLKISQS